MVKIPDFAQVGLQPGGMQAFNDAAIRPLDVDAGREAQQMGRAIEQVGRGLGDYASVLLTQARMEQNELNRTYAVEAFVNYRSKVDKDLYDPQAGYFNKGGKQAFEGERDAVFGRMQQYLDDAEKALPNQATKDLFRNRALLFAEERGLQVDLHAGKERRVYQNAVDEQLLQAEQADVPMLWKDVDEQTFVRDPNAPKTEFQTRLDSFQQNIRDVGAKRGSAPEVIEANVKTATTAVYAQIVDRVANPEKALKLFDQFVADKKIVTQDPLKARNMLQNKVSEKVGQDLAARLWDASGGDYDAASKALNDERRNGNIDVESFNKSDAQLGVFNRQKATAFAARGLNALQTARSWLDNPVNTTKPLGDMPSEMLTALRDTDTLDSAIAYRSNGNRFLNNSATLSDFARAAESGELADMSPEVFEKRFRSGMDDATYMVAAKQWQQATGQALPITMQTMRGGGGGSGGGGGGGAQPPVAPVPDWVSAWTFQKLDDNQEFATENGKPKGTAAITRWTMFQAEFQRQWSVLMSIPANATDPGRVMEQVWNTMNQGFDPKANKYLWEMAPSERRGTVLQVDLPGNRTQNVIVDRLTQDELQASAALLRKEGYPLGAATDALVIQRAVARREEVAMQREMQRKEKADKWVSWDTLQRTLGISKDTALKDIESTPLDGAVHSSDLIYWNGNRSDAKFDFDVQQARNPEERGEATGISRAAYERLLEHARKTNPQAGEPGMTYGQAREYMARPKWNEKGQELQNDPQVRKLFEDMRPTRERQVIEAYELEFPQIRTVWSDPKIPADVLKEYNRLQGIQEPLPPGRYEGRMPMTPWRNK